MVIQGVNQGRRLLAALVVALVLSALISARLGAYADADLQYPCPPGAESCKGLGPGDLGWWLHLCFDYPPSCTTNALAAKGKPAPPVWSRPVLRVRGR